MIDEARLAELEKLAGGYSKYPEVNAVHLSALVTEIRQLRAENARLIAALRGENEDLLWEMVVETCAADALPGYPQAANIAKETFRKVLSRAAARALGVEKGGA